ncbi:hypothetical protein EVAR_83874_1 [Eumeta japonica]|uniref:Uncharacterized protein n=1 Tax=Eumeta variegata TaxID=151549 RepID=A0A4C1UT27_EUMVA|nr:hypothetical protein EVAR_83874_1 [Eumeta japonica]
MDDMKKSTVPLCLGNAWSPRKFQPRTDGLVPDPDTAHYWNYEIWVSFRSSSTDFRLYRSEISCYSDGVLTASPPLECAGSHCCPKETAVCPVPLADGAL